MYQFGILSLSCSQYSQTICLSGWDDNACLGVRNTCSIGAWPNTLDLRPPWWSYQMELNTTKTQLRNTWMFSRRNGNYWLTNNSEPSYLSCFSSEASNFMYKHLFRIASLIKIVKNPSCTKRYQNIRRGHEHKLYCYGKVRTSSYWTCRYVIICFSDKWPAWGLLLGTQITPHVCNFWTMIFYNLKKFTSRSIRGQTLFWVH